MRGRRTLLCFACMGVLLWGMAAGCYTSKPPANSQSSNGGTDPNGGTSNGTEVEGPGSTNVAATQDIWPDYPDVPFVPIMTEVKTEGGPIPIPRLDTAGEDLQVEGPIPADVGNTYAKQHPGEPVTGDWLIIRFNSEPKSMNPIVETSAVQQYLNEYFHGALAWQNPETLEYEPHMAERWVTEDSVKLSPDYAGKERRIAEADGEAQSELEIDYERAASEDEDDPVVTFHTFDGDGQPLGNVWVGLFPVGEVPGAPKTGYHHWSNAEGQLEVSGIVSGDYQVRVGAEVFGKTDLLADGSLKVTPETPGNPLAEALQSSDEKSLTLGADDWINVQEQTVYTYFLRDDVKWQDGTPYTAKDLEFAYAIVNNPYVDGESLRVYYQDLIACEAIDTHTVRMRYRQQYFKSFEFTAGLAIYGPPWHLFAKWFEEDGKELTLEKLTPEDEEAQSKVSARGQVFGKFFNTDERYNLKPLGTGPYTVGEWVRADRIELHRDPNYWNPERGGYLDKLVVKFIPDTVTAFQALKAGEIDFLWMMTPEQYFEDLTPDKAPWFFEKNYVKAAWFHPGFGYIGWNMLKPMFQDRRVRLALNMLFDREEWVEQKLHGEAVIISGSQYYFGPGYDHEVNPLAYDPDTAVDLLAEAGWVDSDNDGMLDKDGQKFEFTLWMPQGSPVAKERAQLFQSSLKRVGIPMEVRELEWASFLDKVKKKDFDAVNLGWAQPLESDPFQIWHGSQAGADKRGSNHVSFSDPLADQLIEQLRVTLDENKRKRIHASFHRIIDREQPYMFLYTAKDFGAYHPRFQGVKWYRIRPGFDLTQWYVPKDQQVH